MLTDADCVAGEGLMQQGVQLVTALRRTLPAADASTAGVLLSLLALLAQKYLLYWYKSTCFTSLADAASS